MSDSVGVAWRWGGIRPGHPRGNAHVDRSRAPERRVPPSTRRLSCAVRIAANKPRRLRPLSSSSAAAELLKEPPASMRWVLARLAGRGGTEGLSRSVRRLLSRSLTLSRRRVWRYSRAVSAKVASVRAKQKQEKREGWRKEQLAQGNPRTGRLGRTLSQHFEPRVLLCLILTIRNIECIKMIDYSSWKLLKTRMCVPQKCPATTQFG